MQTITATVVKHTGSHYLLSKLPDFFVFPSVVRGKIRLQKSSATNPIAVGDRVECILPGDDISSATELDPAVITKVLPRENYIIRRSTNLSREAHVIAANVDRAFIIVTLAFPEVKLPFLDRLLVTCEVYGIPATIVVNKVDLLRCVTRGTSSDRATPLAAGGGAQPEGMGGVVGGCADATAATPDTCDEEDCIAAFRSIYEAAGYPVIETSVKTGEGIEELRAAMATSKDGHNGLGINLLSGVSGVGKSSLIHAIDPSLKPRTGQISLAHLQGKHTTTFYEMYPLSQGGFIIDTPGIRSFGLLDLEPEEISKYFPEMLEASQDCRFTPCTHTHEPHCAVKEAVEQGTISLERYNSYLGMLEEEKKYR